MLSLDRDAGCELSKIYDDLLSHICSYRQQHSQPICQQGQCERIFPIFAFFQFSWFPLFFAHIEKKEWNWTVNESYKFIYFPTKCNSEGSLVPINNSLCRMHSTINWFNCVLNMCKRHCHTNHFGVNLTPL